MGTGFSGHQSRKVSGPFQAFHKVSVATEGLQLGMGKGSSGVSPPTTSPAQGLRCSLSASSRQLRCIAYSCSRVSGSEAVKRRSSSDFIHSWYLQGQRGGLWQARLTPKHVSDTIR